MFTVPGITADAFFWVTSTSAQAVAAVLGFAIAAYTFAYSRLDVLKRENEEDVMESVIASTQKQGRHLVVSEKLV